MTQIETQPERVRGLGLPGEVRERVHLRSRQCCERCGMWCAPPVGEILCRNMTRDIDNGLTNLVHLCRACRAWLLKCPKDAHEEGFHLERGEVPELTELLYGGPYVQEYGRRRALLQEDGGVTVVEDDVPRDGGSWDGSEELS